MAVCNIKHNYVHRDVDGVCTEHNRRGVIYVAVWKYHCVFESLLIIYIRDFSAIINI